MMTYADNGHLKVNLRSVWTVRSPIVSRRTKQLEMVPAGPSSDEAQSLPDTTTDLSHTALQYSFDTKLQTSVTAGKQRTGLAAVG